MSFWYGLAFKTSSTNPSANRKELEPITTQLCVESGTNKSDVPTTDPKIAMPPSIAVGFLCHRSAVGLATAPQRLASKRTKGVSASEKAKAAMTVITSVELKDILRLTTRLTI